MSTNPLAAEYTRYDTFRKERTGPLEFAMYKMWRTSAQMFDLGSGAHAWPTLEQVVERLDKSIEELNQCRNLLTEKTTDRVGFYDEKTQQMSFIDAAPTAWRQE
jgi:prefoldin subunit 5